MPQHTDLMWRRRPQAGLLVTPHQLEQRLSRHLKALPSNVEQPGWCHACKLWDHQALVLPQASLLTLHSLQRVLLHESCACTPTLQGSL